MPSKSKSPTAAATTRPIVFFDGVCGLCNRFIDVLLRLDHQDRLRFAPLQGRTAEQLLGRTEGDDLKSVVFIDGKTVYVRSAAVAAILSQLNWPWRAGGYGLRLLPPLLRDFGYDLIAQNRYRLFGKKATCRLPTPAQRLRFLD